MAIVPGVWGIDIGQCALKAVRLQLIDNVVTATAFDYVEHTKLLSQPDADPDQLTRESLETFLSRNTLKGDIVAIGVPGQSGLARFVKLPPVEEKKITDIVKFEAKQQIPFPLEEVIWDYQKIGSGDVTDGFAIDTEIGLFAMKRDMIARFLGHYTGVNMEVHQIQMAPLSLVNYLIYEQLNKGGPAGDGPMPEFPNAQPGKKKCVCALDIGTDSSILVITDGAKIIWQRQLTLGGSQFTRALTKEMKMTFAKAEHLKRNAAKSPELPQILKALKGVLTEFVGEVQRSLGYFTNTHRDAHLGFMVGLGNAFKLPGLPKYLSEKLQIEIRRPDAFPRLAGDVVISDPVFVENILTYPVSYGLALQGLKLTRLTTNLLPPEITFDRKIRAKKPMAVAAAAMLLLGGSVAAILYSLPYSAAYAEGLDKQQKEDDSIKTKAKSIVDQVVLGKQKVEETKNDVKAIIAGQEERVNHLAINQYINLALPRPGDKGNMLSAETSALWNTNRGKKAVKRFEEQLRQGIDPRIAQDDESRLYLPMLDVEAIYSRFVPDLKAYHEFCGKQSKIETTRSFGGAKELGGLTEFDLANPPVGEGWAVEIRGSTYFTNPEDAEVTTDKFLARTLIQNLRQLQIDKPGLLPRVQGTTADGKPAVDDKGKPVYINPISHVFLWSVIPETNPQGQTSPHLDGSLVDFLVSNSQSASADTTASPTNGPASNPATAAVPASSDSAVTRPGSGPGSGASSASSPATWTPLTGAGATGDSSGGSRVGLSTPGATSTSGAAGGTSPWALGGGGGGTTTSGTNLSTPAPKGAGDSSTGSTASKKPSLVRKEFCVVMIWREPTPSDKLLSPKK